MLGVLFDGTALGQEHGWWSAFGQVGSLVSISAAVFTAGLLIRGRDLLTRLARATEKLGPPEIAWIVAHVVALAGFTAVSSMLFSGDTASSLGVGLTMALWVVAGCASFATLFRATFGSAWYAVARVVFGVLAGGAALGLLAWLAGLRSIPLWDWLAGATLRTSGWLLVPFVESVRVIPEEMLLGIDDFDVTIAAECSGMENLGAVSVFLLGYFYTFREQIRFPQSLLLLPAALVLVFVLNSVRIAALVAVGAYWSSDIALGGFHSKAGWLALCLVALGVVVATRNSPQFARDAPATPSFTDSSTAAYLTPLLAFVGFGLVTELFASQVNWLYPLPVVAASAVAWRYRNAYPPLERGFPIWGVTLGVIAFALWFALAKAPDPAHVAEHELALDSVNDWLRVGWLGFRVLGAVVVVPIVEELAFRGYLQRRLIAEDFGAVPQGKFTPLSLAVSALAFGLLHPSWLAGAAAGVLYSITCYRTGRLRDAIVAHATTNGLLVFAGLGLGRHELWQ